MPSTQALHSGPEGRADQGDCDDTGNQAGGRSPRPRCQHISGLGPRFGSPQWSPIAGSTGSCVCLVAITSGFGHIRPSAPIADAVRRRGHDVRYVVSSGDRLFSGNSRGSGAISPADFATGLGFPTDVVEPSDVASLVERLPAPESDAAAMFRPFFVRAAAAVPFIRTLCDEWEPDVILRDTAGLDAWAIAEQTDTPLATFDFTPAQSVRLHEVAGGEFAWFREAMSLPPEPSGDRLGSELTIVGAAPSWFDGHRLPANTHFVQPMEPDPAPGESVEALLDGEDERPLLYATFGTVFNTPDLVQLVFEAVADLDVRVIATIGMNNEAADMAIPDNVRTVPFLSQGLILEHADMGDGQPVSGPADGSHSEPSGTAFRPSRRRLRSVKECQVADVSSASPWSPCPRSRLRRPRAR